MRLPCESDVKQKRYNNAIKCKVVNNRAANMRSSVFKPLVSFFSSVRFLFQKEIRNPLFKLYSIGRWGP